MSRMLVAVVLAVAISACASHPRSKSASWSECAKGQAIALLASNAKAVWPTVAAIPGPEPMQAIDLGRDPPDATADAFVRTLYLAPNINSIYITQSGGIAGTKKIYGPISLQSYCRVQSRGAP